MTDRSPRMGNEILPDGRIYPHSGTCAHCRRERDDLFWHEYDKALYCADVFSCEARWEILLERRIQSGDAGIPDLSVANPWPHTPAGGLCDTV